MANDFPLYALSEEHQAIREAVRAICDAKVAPHASDVDEQARYPQEAADALQAADFHAAPVPLERASALEPDKPSAREALGRALFHARRYEAAAEEFEAVVDRAPANACALYCRGRSLMLLGRHKEARPPLALTSNLRPGRDDCRKYRDRARLRAA